MRHGTRWPRPLIVGLALLVVYQIVYIAAYLKHSLGSGVLPFGDFQAFWSFALFAHAAGADQIYSVVPLQKFELAVPGGSRGFYPYPYPPIFLLYLWPLGYLTYIPAFAVWIFITFGAYVTALFGPDWRSPRMWVAILAPTTSITILYGQNGLLTAALMTGGFRVMAWRPFIAGLILGALVFKPQLFLLIPIVLVASRQWRCLAGAVASVVVLSAITTVVFGPAVWAHWQQAIPGLWQLFETNQLVLAPTMPTIAAFLVRIGIGHDSVQAIQALIAISIVACLWMLFRRGAGMRQSPRALDIAALQVGAFLATPYAFIYDMPLVSCAVAATYAACTSAGRPWRSGEVMILVIAILLPLIMLTSTGTGWPLPVPLELILLFALILRAGWTLPVEPDEFLDPRIDLILPAAPGE